MSDHFAPLVAAPARVGGSKPKAVAAAFVPVLPVPADAPAPFQAHPSLGAPARTWAYLDAQGRVLGYIHRYNTPDGGKEFRPAVAFRPVGGGPIRWRYESWPAPRPLYGLDRLAARPHAPVVLCEGEKAADAAGMLLPGHVCVTTPGGSKSAGKADLGALKGRDVTIWPDADEPGADYARAIAEGLRLAGAANVGLVTPPEGSAVGWDAGNALEEAWTSERVARLLAGAVPLAAPSPDVVPAPGDKDASNEGTRGGGRPKASDGLLSALSDCEFWHTPEREPYATISVDGHYENWPVSSLFFKDWLADRAHSVSGIISSTKAIEEVSRLARLTALRGPERETWIRTGYGDGYLFIDLCDPEHRAIKIGPTAIAENGRCWEVLEGHKLPFIQSPAMRSLPVPERDDACAIEELRPFVNVAEEGDFILIVAWIIGALRHTGPYPVLVLNGSQGTGKSVLSTLLRSLVDPNTAPIRAAPRDDRDLIIAAVNAHCICLDNLSSVPVWLSDALCRLATGGGFASRGMYTDKTEIVLQARKPILLNGIPALTDRPDLASRAMTVKLVAIPDRERRSEDDVMRAWGVARPRILAALCDALSTALRRFPDVRLSGSPRQADLAKWVTAAESGLGWADGTFLATYGDNQEEMREGAFEANAIAMALAAFARDRRQWTGTATQLLDHVNDITQEATKRQKFWPNTPRKLTDAIDRFAEPLLRPLGITITRARTKHARTITVTFDPTVTPHPAGAPGE